MFPTTTGEEYSLRTVAEAVCLCPVIPQLSQASTVKQVGHEKGKPYGDNS